MDEKPKAITALKWLWLFLSGTFFLLSIVSFGIIIAFIIALFSKGGPEPDIELGTVCSTLFLIIFLSGIIFGIYALKIGISIKKGKKLMVKRGYDLSILSLLIFSSLLVLFVWTGFQNFSMYFLWQFLLIFLLFLTSSLIVIFDIIIIVLSLKSEVKAFMKVLESDK